MGAEKLLGLCVAVMGFCIMIVLWRLGQAQGYTVAKRRYPGKREPSEQLAESIADEFGIYEDRRCDAYEIDDHAENCRCRVFWVPEMTRRIRDASEADRIEAAWLKGEGT